MPLRSLLTKNTAPPPSRAWLRSIRLPEMHTLYRVAVEVDGAAWPPPGVPACAGLAPLPIAWLLVKTLSEIDHETPMLLSAPPLLQTPPGTCCARR